MVGFELAIEVFEDPLHLSVLDESSAEERWSTVGRVGDQVLLLVVHRFRDEGSQLLVLIIWARKATKHERRAYEQ
jgi:uncharacterized DUF497 family protein